MRPVLESLAAAIAALAVNLSGAKAQIVVPLELVLAVDASSSVNHYEYELQMRGIAEAFRSSEVIELITSSGGVAVTLIQWSSRADRERAVPWRLLKHESAILTFASEIERASRAPVGSLTGIGSAISASVAEITGNRFIGRRATIDISGDGHNNTGIPLESARQLAELNGITVNGLAVETDVRDLTRYYLNHVVIGADAFVMTAADYTDFADARRAKLLRELEPVVSMDGPPGPRHTHLMRD